ncbi:MAG: AAA family ATPase, partial [Bacteroidota bacterium]
TVSKIFMTGVTPITLDSLTSGFNIATKLTTDVRLNEMFGFTQAEVLDILENINVPLDEIPSILTEMTHWYNGYLFNRKAKEKIYNPDMVLYFAKEYLINQSFPDELLDTNIASDYRKVRNLFKLDNQEAANITIIKSLLTTGSAVGELTREYSFEKTWTKDDLLSLLFYQGILTIAGSQLNRLTFEIPNAVIKQLYFSYFQQLTLMEANIQERQLNIWQQVEQLAIHNRPQPVLDLMQEIIAKLATQDRAHFNELTFKAIFTAIFYGVNIYKIYSEREVRKSKTQKGRVDLLLLQRPPFDVPHQFVLELKYLSKKEMGQWETVKQAAIQQLSAYLKHDQDLQQLANLRAYVFLFSPEKSEAVVVS